jgi:hypothetical protein
MTPVRCFVVGGSIRQIFRNAILLGLRCDALGRTTLKVDPTVDRDTWNELQAKRPRQDLMTIAP